MTTTRLGLDFDQRARLRRRERRDREGRETFVRRENAERFLAEVRCDDPELADRLGVETIELDA